MSFAVQAQAAFLCEMFIVFAKLRLPKMFIVQKPKNRCILHYLEQCSLSLLFKVRESKFFALIQYNM